MYLLLRSVIVFLLIFFVASAFGSTAEEAVEEFSEELLLKPLPDRKVLSHFHFQSKTQSSSFNFHGRHHHLFPKAISQLVHKFRVKEMELSFTRGRWNYESWGGFDPISSRNAKPPGVELWAVFDVPPDQVDATWKNLTHSLAGLFCASINFLESSTTYSAPKWGFLLASGNLRYGTLPREAVCTENLTPWLKLLPCRDKSGLAALMDRPSIYRGFYHSQRLHVISTGFNSEAVGFGIVLDQTLTLVLQPSSQRTSSSYSTENLLQPSWSLSSIFGKKISGRCALSKSSNIYLQLERGLVSELESLQQKTEVTSGKSLASEGFRGNPGFTLSVNPGKILQEVESKHNRNSSVLYAFPVEKYSEPEPFDLSFTWKVPVVWSCSHAPLHATRFLMGSGNERGAIAISLISTELSDSFMHADVIKGRCELHVNIFQVVPWYIKVYFHTLQVFVDEKPQAVTDVIEKVRVSPSEDKVSPGVMELALKFPCGMKSAAVIVEFDKGFLHIDEYPPDANQGFDIPSAVISFPDFHASMQFVEEDSSNKSPFLSKLQEKNPVLSYSEVLLVPLTTPDFSMPYNVIMITCTIFALYFGSMLNVIRRRVGEEQRYMKRKAAKETNLLSWLPSKLRGRLRAPQEPGLTTSSSYLSSKLILRVMFVAGLAILWQYYFG